MATLMSGRGIGDYPFRAAIEAIAVIPVMAVCAVVET
jgi:hypothetical protein